MRPSHLRRENGYKRAVRVIHTCIYINRFYTQLLALLKTCKDLLNKPSYIDLSPDLAANPLTAAPLSSNPFISKIVGGEPSGRHSW